MGDYLTFHTVATFLVALGLGGMTFFSLVMTPLVFRHFSREDAGAFLAGVFPVYYRIVATLSVIAAVPIWYRWEAAALAGVGAVAIFAWLVLLPRIERLRPARQGGEPNAVSSFRRLHAFSVVLNLAQMAILIVVFFRLVR